jgi:DNA-binding IclR family transcriptional regulator
MEKLTPNAKSDPRKLHRELYKIREVSCALAFEEIKDGLHPITAPIVNHESVVIVSVSVSGPEYRLSREYLEKISEHVTGVAAKVSID